MGYHNVVTRVQGGFLNSGIELKDISIKMFIKRETSPSLTLKKMFKKYAAKGDVIWNLKQHQVGTGEMAQS